MGEGSGLHVSYHGCDFDNGEDEFCFSVTLDAEEVDHDDQDQEDGYPGSVESDVLDLYSGSDGRLVGEGIFIIPNSRP